MEYIVGIAVIAAVYFAFFRKKEEVTVVEEAPYKVETPEAKVEAVNAQPVVEEAKPATAKKAPAKKAPAKKASTKAKAPAKKTARKPKA